MARAVTGTHTYVLVPGAGGQAWYWYRLVDELSRRGNECVAVELPAGSEDAGMDEYADAVIAAIGQRQPLIVVAQSLGGFTGALVCSRVDADLLVMLNAMIPRPGETAGEWWTATGQSEARQAFARSEGRPIEFDVVEDFFHDVPPDVVAEAMSKGEPRQADRPFSQPLGIDAWPPVRTRAIVGADDRLFPRLFQIRVCEERLGFSPDVIPGGHLVALSQPVALADQLERYRTELTVA